MNIIEVGINSHKKPNSKNAFLAIYIVLATIIISGVYFSSSKAAISTNGLSLFGTSISTGTVEATKFCTGDGETNCVTDFSAIDTDTTLGEATVESYIENDITTDYIPRNNGSKLVTGTIYDNGTNIGIGTSSPGQKLTVNGTIESSSGGFKFPDGTTQSTSASIYALRDYARNLVIKNNTTNPNYQVDIDADEVILQNGSDEAKRVSSVNLTADITSSGADGLDTGSEATSTWYHIWVINNGSTTSSLLSTSYTSPTMPSSYTFKAYLGAIYNDASNNFISLHQFGKTATIDPITALSGGIATSYTSFSLASSVPPNAVRVHADAGMNKTYYTWSRQGAYFKPSSSSTIGEKTLMNYVEAIGGYASHDGEITYDLTMSLLESQTLYYKCYNSRGSNSTYCNNNSPTPGGGGTAIMFRVTGWDLP